MAGIVHLAWYTYCKGKFKSNDAQLRAGQYVSSLEQSSGTNTRPTICHFGARCNGWVGNWQYIVGSTLDISYEPKSGCNDVLASEQVGSMDRNP
jgi:hypothetical protein